MRRGSKPGKAKVAAKLPVARKLPKNEASRVRDLEKRLAEALEREAEALKREAEALEQQAATAEILRIISSSPSDLQPVFDAIAESAARVCGATDSHIDLLEGDVLRVVAIHGERRPSVEVGDTFAATPATTAGRAVSDRRTIHVEDLEALPETEYPETRARVRRAGIRTRTLLVVPLLREGAPLGVIVIRREVVRPFSARQIALLETFADQAVIAIENVRLFNETKEALEQQTATAEILRVISQSPTDVQPVLDAVAENAARLCQATDAIVLRVEGDGLRLAASYGALPTTWEPDRRLPISRGMPSGRAVIDRRPIHVHDLLAAPDAEFAEAKARARLRGTEQFIRTVLATPLLHNERSIGAIVIRKAQVQPFSDKQIALVQTFADQAVIAIENVRLFTELQEKNRALTAAHAQVTEALEQQTATSEVLKVISRSTFDLQPVLDTLIENATRLCDATQGLIYLSLPLNHPGCSWRDHGRLAVGRTAPH